MGLLSAIDRIREKPYGYRLRVTVMASTLFTAVIVAVWFLYTLIDFSPDERRQVAAPSGQSPFERLREGWNGAREAYEGFFDNPAP